MKTRSFFVAILMLIGFSSVYSQGFQPPSAGKAAVYFCRINPYGFAVSFDFFNNANFVGAFKGTNYIRIECDPGEQALWASSENNEFITADLKAGDSYIIIVDVITGVMKARVGLTPISSADNDFPKCKKMIIKDKPANIPDSKVESKNKKLQKKTVKEMEHYNETKVKRSYRQLTPEMAIPLDAQN